jgi:formylglycine-generating enzyme required for sulfatase activity
MGAVYLGVHEKLGREAAVKVLPSALVRDNPDFIERFFVEARAAALVDHPNVVRVYDADESQGVYFIAMEYVRGVDLRDLIRRKGALTSLEASEIAVQAARGLGAAAERNIIHRDIKPANLMITESGVVKVADFGLAKNTAAAQGITQSGQVMGTPAYMSPEQAEGVPTDFRTDIYSLGVTIFEMVTGRRPFMAETTLGLLRKHLDAPIPDPGDIEPGVDPRLAQAIVKMMAKSREDRYDGYAPLVSELKEIVATLQAGEDMDNLNTLNVHIADRIREEAVGPPSPDVSTPVTAAPATDIGTAAPATDPGTEAPRTRPVQYAPRKSHPWLWAGAVIGALAATAAVLFATGVLDRFFPDASPAVTARSEANVQTKAWTGVEWVFKGRKPENVVRAQMLLERGEGLFVQEKYEPAAREFTKARDFLAVEVGVGQGLISDLAQDLSRRARDLAEAGDFDDALEEIDRFLQHTGITEETSRKLGVRREEVAEALEAADFALLEGEVRTLVAQGGFESALNALERFEDRARFAVTREAAAALVRDVGRRRLEEERISVFPLQMRALARKGEYASALGQIDAFHKEAISGKVRELLKNLKAEVWSAKDEAVFLDLSKEVSRLLASAKYADALGSIERFLADVWLPSAKIRAVTLRHEVLLAQVIRRCETLMEQGRLREAQGEVQKYLAAMKDKGFQARVLPLKRRIERDLREEASISAADLVEPRRRAGLALAEARKLSKRPGAGLPFAEITALWSRAEKALALRKLLLARRSFESCTKHALALVSLRPVMDACTLAAGAAQGARAVSELLKDLAVTEWRLAKDAFEAGISYREKARYRDGSRAFEGAKKGFLIHQEVVARASDAVLAQAGATMLTLTGERLAAALAAMHPDLRRGMVWHGSRDTARRLLGALSDDGVYTLLSSFKAPERDALLRKFSDTVVVSLSLAFARRKGILLPLGGEKDQFRNPVVRRKGTGGCPVEVWLSKPRLELVLIPAGRFTLGSQPKEQGRYRDEGPPTPVTFEEPFYIGKYEVTQAQWINVMGTNPSRRRASKNPVDNVSWEDCRRFLHKLNRQLQSGAGLPLAFRLPSEAEWEYACRAGAKGPFALGGDEAALARGGWYRKNAQGQTHPVGRKTPNAFGLYDTHGNALEWCADTWHDGHSGASPKGRARTGTGPGRVLRGGSWAHRVWACRAACRYRGRDAADDRGFRVVLWVAQR